MWSKPGECTLHSLHILWFPISRRPRQNLLNHSQKRRTRLQYLVRSDCTLTLAVGCSTQRKLRKHPPHAIAHHSRCKAIQHHPKFRPVQVKLEIEMRVIILYHSYEQGDTIVIHPIFLQLQHTITLTYDDNYNYKHCWSTYWACGPWGHFLPDSGL